MNNLALTPDKLRNKIAFEIAQACKCDAVWLQDPVTEEQVADVRVRINRLLDSLLPAEVAA